MIDAGFRAEFATGYLQREIILHQCDVSNGIDESVHNSATKGFAVGRLVKVTKDSNGKYTITEIGKDDSTDYDLSAVLDSFIGLDGISLSIGVDDDVPAVTEE